jgi:hypothetical protein
MRRSFALTVLTDSRLAVSRQVISKKRFFMLLSPVCRLLCLQRF